MKHKSRLNEKGHETLDDTPLAIPVGFRQPESLSDTIKRLVRTELSNTARASGAETFEESDDFNVGDDFDPSSPWELKADQESADTSFHEEVPNGQPTKAQDPVPGHSNSAVPSNQASDTPPVKP